jgi:thymidine kinase
MSLKLQNKHDKPYGKIEVICGSMFSGKTEMLISIIKKAKISREKVKNFKPKLDNRYDSLKIVSHNKNEIPATPIENIIEIVKLSKQADIIAIDEAQFFNDQIVGACIEIAATGCNVILAGLDLDHLGNPFGAMPRLMSIADKITKLHAICDLCSTEASHTFKKTNDKKQIEIGEKDKYQALCRSCFNWKISRNE